MVTARCSPVASMVRSFGHLAGHSRCCKLGIVQHDRPLLKCSARTNHVLRDFHTRKALLNEAQLAAFTPRPTFPSHPSLPRSYYLGHHAKALSKLKTLASQTDLVLECRDYRIPLSSRNPLLERAMAGVERIIVYTKWDLGRNPGADRTADSNEMIMKSWGSNSETKTKLCFLGRDAERKGKGGLGTIKTLLAMIKDSARQRWSLTGMRVLVAGIPNVGKSTLLNALRAQGVRKGKAAQTGGSPGITRSVGTLVKIIDGSELDAMDNDQSSTQSQDAQAQATNGSVYILDTPGIFMPYVASQDSMLKLALCGNVKETLVPPTVLADYLLFRLNLVNPQFYAKHFTEGRPTNDINELLGAIASKTGRLMKSKTKERKEKRERKLREHALAEGDEEAFVFDTFGDYEDFEAGSAFDIEATALWFVQRWRNGHLGKFALDDINEDSAERWAEEEENRGPSLNQAKKADKEARRERMRQKMSKV